MASEGVVDAGGTDWRALALEGKWNELARAAQPSTTVPLAGRTRADVTCATYYFLALFKLRRYAALAEETEAYGDFAAAAPLAGSGATLQEPAIPFALGWLYGEGPLHSGDAAKGLDRLYTLLEFSRRMATQYQGVLGHAERVGGGDPGPVSDVEAPPAGEGAGAFAMQRAWRRRAHTLACVLACHHCTRQEYAVALRLVSDVIASGKGDGGTVDPRYLALAAYVLLQLGDVESAAHVASELKRVEAAAASGAGSPAAREDAERLRTHLDGLVLFASNEHQQAALKFDAACSILPGDPVAANNKAVSHMYAKDLHISIKLLETRLSETKAFTLHRPMVLNLCSMYELASAHAKDKKEALRTWILQHASDEFDATTTRTT